MLSYNEIKQNMDLIKDYKKDDLIELICSSCNKIYKVKKKSIVATLYRGFVNNNFCSIRCNADYRNSISPANEFACDNCNTPIKRTPSHLKKHKHGFCSQSCSGQYYNKHKTHGFRRSKLEMWLEEQLKQIYPTLNILFNNRNTFGIELDIFVPELKIAFELNGIFHYEPIFGKDKLDNILLRDKNKVALCREQGIAVAILDVSRETNFKPSKSQKYLDIICNIINELLD